MISDYVCASIAECRSRIEDDFKIDLTANMKSHDVLLRGENYPYEKTESSMKRFLTADDGKTIKPLYFVSPFIDFEEIYADYHSTTHQLSEEEGAGFLQHYGFPTDLFDLSPSFDTARFFASHGRERDPIGIIGTFYRAELEMHFTITDLSKHPFAQRPRNQSAYAGKPGPGIIDLKSSHCENLFTTKWYRFKKSSDDLEFASAHTSISYPTEAEIAYFFSRDLDEFFKHHRAYKKMTEEQRLLVQEQINSIRAQLKG